MAATNDLIPDFEDFERYYSGEMSSAEQRLLEGRMLAEPLVAEAYEGFLAWRTSSVGTNGVRADLHGRLHTRMGQARKKALPLWSYASAASVLLALFSYWFVFVRDQKADVQETAAAVKQEKETLAKPEQAPAAIQPDKPLGPSVSAPAVPETPEPAAKIQAQQPIQPQASSPASETLLIPSTLADAENREDAKDVAAGDSFAGKAEEVGATPLPEKALTTPASNQAVGKSMAGRARMERQEVDTKHFVAAKPASAEKKAYTVAVPLDTLPPAPVEGWPAYRTYLDKNTGTASTTGRIVVTFFVSSTGILSGFVASGPDELHKEAIRIIANGPAWLPAHTKGIPVTSRAEIQLQFRQSQ
jgi:hypothetical protein